MAAFDFYIKQSDLLPVLTVAPKDATGAGVLFAGGSTATFSMWSAADTTVVIVNAAAAVIGTGADGKSTLSYTWVAPNTATPGAMRGRFAVTTSSKVETFPTPGHLNILVDATLA